MGLRKSKIIGVNLKRDCRSSYPNRFQMKKYTFLLFLFCLVLTCTQAQKAPSIIIGTGMNSSLQFSSFPYSAPYLPIAPYLNIKIKRHEVVIGADLYNFPFQYHNLITGVQAAYRYHFLRGSKASHLFLDCNLQYVQFQSVCGDPIPYHNSDAGIICYDGVSFKNKLFTNTFGWGIKSILKSDFQLMESPERAIIIMSTDYTRTGQAIPIKTVTICFLFKVSGLDFRAMFIINRIPRGLRIKIK
jgi:hypothetical protein